MQHKILGNVLIATLRLFFFHGLKSESNLLSQLSFRWFVFFELFLSSFECHRRHFISSYQKTIHLTKDSRVKVTFIFIFIFTKLIQYQKTINTYCLKLSCHSPCRINGCKSFNHKHVIEGYER